MTEYRDTRANRVGAASVHETNGLFTNPQPDLRYPAPGELEFDKGITTRTYMVVPTVRGHRVASAEALVSQAVVKLL